MFNLRGHNCSSYPTLQMRFSFDAVSDLPIAINASVAAPGFKDQSAAFPAGSDVHFYAIYGASVPPSGVSSLSPPPTGPMLGVGHLAGYTEFVYLTTIKLDTIGGLVKSEVRGKQVFFREISHYPVFLVNPDRFPPAEPPGHALVDTPIDMRPIVPAIAQTFDVFVDAQLVVNTHSSLPASSACILQIKEGETYAIVSCFAPAHQATPSTRLKANAQDYTETFPNPADGLIYYRWSDIDGTADIVERYLSIFMRGYKVP